MNNLFIQKSFSLSSSIRKMNRNAQKTLIVVDSSNKLLGILSDGDIRKSIISGKKLSDKIADIYNKNPYYVFDGKFILDNLKEVFLKKKYNLIPVLNKKLIIKKLLLGMMFSMIKKSK